MLDSSFLKPRSLCVARTRIPIPKFRKGGSSSGKLLGFKELTNRENITMKAMEKIIGRLIVGCLFACCLTSNSQGQSSLTPEQIAARRAAAEARAEEMTRQLEDAMAQAQAQAAARPARSPAQIAAQQAAIAAAQQAD